MAGFGLTRFDWVGLAWTGVMDGGLMGLPGGVLPVNPSTFRDCRDLQKFDPSDYPSGAVRLPVRSSTRLDSDVGN